MTVVPLTRPVTILLHDTVVPTIQDIADHEHDGNLSKYVRSLIYVDLLRRKLITPQELQDLRG